MSLRDNGLWAVLATTAALLAWTWATQEGYQIADSVEYLERAQGIAHGDALIDSVAIRGFGFSGLLVPLFWIYDGLGLSDPVRIMQAAQLLQVCLTLALVGATARLCARFAGRAGGLAAGALLGFNPIVLRWGVEPVSGIAAALFVTLAIARATGDRRVVFAWPAWRAQKIPEPAPARPPLRDAWITGGWLGLAFLMAYQTIPVVGAVFLVLIVRDLRRNPLWIFSALAALLCVVLLQCALDVWYYGSFGISVTRYFIENFGSTAARWFSKGGDLPLVGPYFHAISRWIYNGFFRPGENTMAYQNMVVAGNATIPSKLHDSWYLTQLAHCLVAPTMLLVAIGLLRCLVQALRGTALLWFVVVVNVLAMSVKGSKDFRLWLPFLPLLSALGGIGFAAIFLRGRLLQLAGVALIGSALVLGVREHRATNTRKYGGYWRAISFVNQRAASEHARQKTEAPAEELPVRFRLSAAYHWSMFLRETREVELIKLPHQLDGWKYYDAASREEDLATLATLDGFITHLPVLTENPDLFEVINRDFAVTAAYYDRVVYDSLGPIYVLERRPLEQGGLRFFQREEGRGLEDLAREAGHGPLLEFESPRGDSAEKLALIEARYTPLAGDGHGWISYVWHGGPLAAPDWTIVDRLTAPDYQNSWQNNHQPAYDMVRTSGWSAGTTLREGYLVVAEERPWDPDVVYHRLGGGYRRGDLIPVTLWVDVVHMDERGEVLDRMEAIDPVTRERVAEIAPTLGLSTPSGATTFDDGMTRAKSMFLPVHPAGRLPDDGRAVPLTEPR